MTGERDGSRAGLGVQESFLGTVAGMYVQRWRAAPGGRYAGRHVVLVHGGAHTGVCWTTTPDGRAGWAPLLALAGWEVHVVDWPGCGRSRPRPDVAAEGPGPVVAALAELLVRLREAVVVSHSFGVPLALKAMDQAPGTVSASVALAPSAPGNVRRPGSPLPTSSLRFVSETDVLAGLANSDRFPREHLPAYLASMCGWSPSIQNACGDVDGSGALVVDAVPALRSVPHLVLAADQDALSPLRHSQEVAEFLQADLVQLSRDWELPGFGHMIPLERGTEEVLDHVLTWLDRTLAPL